MSTYPSNIPVFPTLTDEVDVVAANDENSARNEIMALCQYIGTNPQGSMPSVASRLNVILNGSGVINNSSGFPDGTLVASYPCQLFYRSDAETLYVRRHDNTAWAAVGQSAANLLFAYTGHIDGQGTAFGEATANTLNSGASNSTSICYYRYLLGASGSLQQVWSTKFEKIAGITTVTVYVRMWHTRTSGSYFPSASISIGGLTGTCFGAAGASNPLWYSVPITVSSLINGSFYDVLFSMYDGTGNAVSVACSDIIGFGS